VLGGLAGLGIVFGVVGFGVVGAGGAAMAAKAAMPIITAATVVDICFMGSSLYRAYLQVSGSQRRNPCAITHFAPVSRRVAIHQEITGPGFS